MRTKPLQIIACLALAAGLLAGCSQSTPMPSISPTAAPIMLTETAVPAQTATEAQPTQTETVPAAGEAYEPVSAEVCRMLQETAAQALAVDFSLEEAAPFEDTLAGEGGQGCRLMAAGDGTRFSDLQSIMETLTGSVGAGWNEQLDYQADGPTGTAKALTRDMALMLLAVNWAPAEDVVCPADQPISACNLTPDQKVYTVEIDVAQYRADFSLDGHWEDAADHFSLDLYQEWKHIYGHHTVVAQGGNKIDTLDVSIDGSLQGKVATVQFQSSFTSNAGVAEITYVDVNTIHWKIITPPDGEYYLPAEAVLTR
ncbi:hypothetical protein LARV_00440 [Longilinea arvoryzae]|uniref:Uncharacterized protein n=1 Tax=Longilinea arvoryzae TaxID=360412 RepID=A0A0S7BD31_9CHLR|nr:hypothetical protein [Longilinea arvoryzae]GAP12704.1 hypothetical protein LARV_00440 [Longilinea arvoryzae]